MRNRGACFLRETTGTAGLEQTLRDAVALLAHQNLGLPRGGKVSDAKNRGIAAGRVLVHLLAKQHTLMAEAEFKFACPHCHQHLQCRQEFSGRQIQCPTCKVLIRIPAVPGQTAQFTPESGMTWATFVPEGVTPPPPARGVKPPRDKSSGS